MSFSSILLLRGQRVAGVLPMPRVAVATRRWSPAVVLLPYRACSSSSSRATASTGAGPAAASPSAASPPAAQVHDMSDIKFAVRHPVAWWRANSAKLKDMFKRYGYFAVGTYLGVYVLTLAGMYGLVSTGVIAGPDVNEWLNNWSVKKALSAEPVHLSQRFQNFAMAWIMTKPTEPLRLLATIVIVPMAVKRLPPSWQRFFRITPEQVAAKVSTSAPPAATSASTSAAQAAATASTGAGAAATKNASRMA